MTSASIEKDLILIVFSVFLSIFLGQNIIKSITDRVLIFVSTLLQLEFRDRLKTLKDPNRDLDSGLYADFLTELEHSKLVMEKSVRCNISACIWLLFSFLTMYFLQKNGQISDDHSTLLKIIVFFTTFLYISYYSWSFLDSKKNKFAHNKDNINTLSRHNLLIFYAFFSIPFLTGNFSKWSDLSAFSYVILIILIMIVFTRVYRSICINRFENKKINRKTYYLSGVNWETFIYAAVFFTLITILNVVPTYFNLEITPNQFRDYSLVLSLGVPLGILFFSFYKTVKPACILHYFADTRFTSTRE